MKTLKYLTSLLAKETAGSKVPHVLGHSAVLLASICLSVLLNLSQTPFVSGWYELEDTSLIPNIFLIPWVVEEINSASLSERMASGKPILEKTNRRASVIASLVMNCKGIAWEQLVLSSTNVNMYLLPLFNVIFSGPTISIASFSKDLEGMSVSCLNAPWTLPLGVKYFCKYQ